MWFSITAACTDIDRLWVWLQEWQLETVLQVSTKRHTKSFSIEALRATRGNLMLLTRSRRIKNKIISDNAFYFRVSKQRPTYIFFWHLNIFYYRHLPLLLLEHVILGELCSSYSPVQGCSAPLSWFHPPGNEEHGYQVACDSCCVRASRGPERRWHWQVPPCRIKGTTPFPVSLSVSLCISAVSDGVTLRGARWLQSRWMPCRISAWELHRV